MFGPVTTMKLVEESNTDYDRRTERTADLTTDHSTKQAFKF